jgi:hypothetical protein
MDCEIICVSGCDGAYHVVIHVAKWHHENVERSNTTSLGTKVMDTSKSGASSLDDSPPSLFGCIHSV